MVAPIEHVVVLMMENRSFDYMFGFLDHPDSSLERLKGDETNTHNGTHHPVFKNAEYDIQPDPGHSHVQVMTQLYGSKWEELADVGEPDNSGFVEAFAQKIKDKRGSAVPEDIMRCLDPQEQLPILATLACEFAICDHWFSSLPGETWPNRHYAFAGTSEGTVDIQILKKYQAKTLFHLLEEHDLNWAIYFDGFPPQVWGAFRFRLEQKRFKRLKSFYHAIDQDKLPSFSFIEPDHFEPGANSQHPSFARHDFLEGEQLIHDIYKGLTGNPRVWEKTLLIITYDEHGGFYDHIPPPKTEAKIKTPYVDRDYRFDFDRLGVRVPTVLISPYIRRGTVDHNDYDHASIISTVCDIFNIPEHLTERDRDARSCFDNLTLTSPRAMDDVPNLETELSRLEALQEGG